MFDCTTKLNSTYLMKVALIFKDICTCLKHRDNQYKQVFAYWSSVEVSKSTMWAFEALVYHDRNVMWGKNMAKSMLEKFGKYWDEIYGVMAVVVVVLDLKYKMVLVD